ncbi:MAG: alpha/beta fold hydrolase [Saprospiraceae bacterium]|jgi:pimeloyl-ACP methyl ester carboxylesterase|nr:alpha/beta fold hydrolase [Saprospiraceae bacterium]MBK6815189.1 alpha/beta fold hydrolase [Saprospiraceae bacterium]MBK7372227.1 alpha/beta fold hydrolase [Saprospiraceae bacterium]MBK7435309.1 alpha/beta fold hydrolase [Saprospiraceae bacterium]MBK7607711.1 alpha/beta fold hydrolase [Saprospiraceae bacterium]
MNLYSKIYGEGRATLVILHGLFGSSDNWQTFAKSIADRYQVITIDLRNHGLSPHDPEFDFECMAGDLQETFDTLNLSKINLMGHSLGGKVAGYFALNHPSYLRSLIVIDIAPKSYPPHHELYFNAMLGLNLEEVTTRTQADHWLSKQITDAGIRQFLLKNLMRDDAGTFKWRFNLQALYRHYDNINIPLSSDHPFSKPALFIKGENSNYILPDDAVLIKELFTHAEVKQIDGAGHWVHADQPVRLKEMVLEFLDNSN